MKRPSVQDVLRRRLLFVSGKGGVGKTAVSQAVALALARRRRRTLWVAFEDPTRPTGELTSVAPNLWHLNCDAERAFEEYAALKIGTLRLTQLFVRNRLMRYLSKAAPGIHELVLVGKVWYERDHFDHVVVDMPSTGYGLAMFQSVENFARLFHGGPLHRDAEAMLRTFGDASQTGQLIVALPEEMPLRESLELDEYLLKLFPANPAAFVANRRFPDLGKAELETSSDTPLAASLEDYVRRRSALEGYNLRIWRDQGLAFGELPYEPPPLEESRVELVERLSGRVTAQGWVA
jgi:anion-transporting  ArsA/GET3 family ATPase